LNCGAVNLMAAQPCSSMIVAGLNDVGLWATTDAGATWNKLGATGDVISNGVSRIIFDPATPTTFWESGIYGWQDPWTMGVFVTKDNGASFKGYLQMSIIQSHQDSVSIDFNDPARLTQLSGGHEQKGGAADSKNGVLLSTDGGENFAPVGDRLPAGIGFCTSVFVLNAQNLLVACAASWSGGTGGIARSGDAGATWTKVSDKGANGHPLWASDGALYWHAEQGGMLKSTDAGLTWNQLSDGSPASQFTSPQSPEQLPDGRILSANASHIVVSADGGVTFSPIGDPLPSGNHFTYSAASKTFFSWGDGGCMKAGWDYTAN
jgi:photosystem II stability/assembly factor-like uncharacterized protein